MKNIREKIFLILTLFIIISSCDSPTENDKEKGGTHIPQLPEYQIAAVPEEARTYGVQGREYYNDENLRRFVHLAERYQICLAKDVFSEDQLTSLQNRVKKNNGPSDSFGLEGIINLALKTIDKFKPDSKIFSSRIDIETIWADKNSCHLLILKAGENDFPFNHPDFSAEDRVLFYMNQLDGEDKTSNKIPIAYLKDTVAGETAIIALQHLIGNYFGLGESQTDGSYLNSQTTSDSPSRGWFVFNENGEINLGKDAMIVYSFALLYRDLLKPKDLETFHYYEDLLIPVNGEEDPDLVLPAKQTNISFIKKPGNLYLTGVRKIKDTIPICTLNLSGFDLANEDFQAYFGFMNSNDFGSLGYYLHEQEKSFSMSAEFSEDSCSLLVIIKNLDQYPFSDKKVNGLYAEEGSIRTKDGAKTSIPVIYLNASNLHLSPTKSSEKEYVGFVLEHEFAHFLGLKHSPSEHSILSASGYNVSWDLYGGDEKMFAEYLGFWKEVK